MRNHLNEKLKTGDDLVKQSEQSKINKKAWEYRSNEHWENNYGTSLEKGSQIKTHPETLLTYYLEDLGNVSGKKIANLLGSAGIRAVSLAALGADVTVVDISSKNSKYALSLAKEAGVDITYIVSDVFEIDKNVFRDHFDIVFMEFGILHYFSDITRFFKLTYDLLKFKGFILFRDFHPVSSKLITISETGQASISGNYFNQELMEEPVAYEGFFPKDERVDFPKTLLRKWTISEVISALSEAGFIIHSMKEEPNKFNKNIPANYMIKANK